MKQPTAPGRSLRLVAFALALAGLLTAGCDMGLQGQLDDKKSARFAEAAAKVADVEKQRHQAFSTSVPAKDAKPEGRVHPMLKWRYQAADLQFLASSAEQGALKLNKDLRTLSTRRFTTTKDAEDEITKIFAQSPGSTKLRDAVIQVARTKAGREFENEILAAINKYSPVKDYDVTLTGLADQDKGTPAMRAALDGAAFAKTSREFWAHAVKHNFARMTGTVNRYVGFLKGYLAEAQSKAEKAAKDGDGTFVQRPFLDEAGFDIVFVHAAMLYARTNPVPFWEMAFNFKSRGRDTMGTYVTRLCRESEIRDKCKKVPHELRTVAIRKPYLEWIKAEAAKYVASHKVDYLNNVLKGYDEALAKAISATPTLEEDPIMPEVFSERAGSSGFTLTMSPKTGVRIHSRRMQELKLADSFTGKVPAGFKAKLEAKIKELKETEGNTVVFDTIILEAPGDMSSKQLRKLMTNVPFTDVRKFDLVGRKRADDSLKRNGVLMQLPEAAGKTISYQLQGAEERTKCPWLGRGGAYGRRTKAGSVLVIGKDKAQAAVQTRNEETKQLDSGPLTLDVPSSDWKAIQDWADKNPGIVRLFVDSSYSYNDFMRYLTGILYKCVDTTVKVGPRLDKTLTIKCGTADKRDITVAFAICN